MPEPHSEQIARVEMMAAENNAWDDSWDLSDNDKAALTTVLTERAELLKWLKWYADNPGGHPEARIAIGKAEGIIE
jgi:hypothetical protein